MSIAQVSFDLRPRNAVLSDVARAGNGREPRLPLAATPAPPPPTPPGISRQQLGALIVQNMCGLERFASSLTPQRADAQDLVQETCRKALVAHAMFVPGTNVGAWLRCILRNLHRDWVRHGWHEIPVAGPCETWATPVPDDQPFWSRVSDDDVARALAGLPPIYRTVYVLRATEGYSYHEIARTLCIPQGTVGTRLSRARGLLRKLLLSNPAAAHSRRPGGKRERIRAGVVKMRGESPGGGEASHRSLSSRRRP